MPVSDIHLIYYYARETARSKKRKYIGYRTNIDALGNEDTCIRQRSYMHTPTQLYAYADEAICIVSRIRPLFKMKV